MENKESKLLEIRAAAERILARAKKLKAGFDQQALKADRDADRP